jgi:AcrR family transcriptional regulator
MPRRLIPAAPPPNGTRARIAAAALELFNAQGAHAVSTRHVAEALGISPGNLYYHFGNKEEIVSELCAEIDADLSRLLEPPAGRPAEFSQLLGYVDGVFAHLWRYRFFYRDLPTLLPSVPGLRERYRAMAGRVGKSARRIYASMVEAGWMRASDEELDMLATNGWLVLTQWLPHQQMRRASPGITAADVNAGIRHFAALFRAYLKPRPRAELDALLARYR